MSDRFRPWQFWQQAKVHLGKRLVLLWGKRNARVLRLYSQNPAFTERDCKCPLERLWNVFFELKAVGRADVARQALAYLESAIEDRELEELFALDDIKATIEAEVLADFRAVAELQDAIDAGDDSAMVELIAKKAMAEIERTVAKYKKDHKEGK